MHIVVHVTPGSSRSDVLPGNPWRVHVHARATGGRANEELVRVLAAWFQVSPSHVRIVSGQTTRDKRVEIVGVDAPVVKESL